MCWYRSDSWHQPRRTSNKMVVELLLGTPAQQDICSCRQLVCDGGRCKPTGPNQMNFLFLAFRERYGVRRTVQATRKASLFFRRGQNSKFAFVRNTRIVCPTRPRRRRPFRPDAKPALSVRFLSPLYLNVWSDCLFNSTYSVLSVSLRVYLCASRSLWL